MLEKANKCSYNERREQKPTEHEVSKPSKTFFVILSWGKGRINLETAKNGRKMAAVWNKTRGEKQKRRLSPPYILQIGFHLFYVAFLHGEKVLGQGENGRIRRLVFPEGFCHIDHAHGVALDHHAGQVRRGFILDGL